MDSNASTNGKRTRRTGRPDFATIAGIVAALAGILGGLLLEGGSIADVAQFTAALVVFGGTLGAVLITTPVATCIAAGRKLPQVFFDRGEDIEETLRQILEFAARVRKTGIVSLEPEIANLSNPFLQKAVSLAVDGSDLKELRDVMELEIQVGEQNSHAHAAVYESAGGYAPTIGIIGAVLGLIQVMKHLENIEEVGKGIAVAFVATVYGVGSANLFFLPAAAKLKARAREAVSNQEMILEGVCSIIEGMNPRMIARKLEPFVRNPSTMISRTHTRRTAGQSATAA